MSGLVKKQYDSMRDMNIFELQEAFVKTIIRDTIETYSGQWRLVHEAVQNAHDHIQLNTNISKGLIEIHLYVGSNSVVVKDNGTGIDIEKFENIFLLGGSDKTGASLRKILKGSQGVGIKSTLFTSTTFKVETVYRGYTWKHELENCYRFFEPEFKLDLDKPQTKPSSSSSGSTFTYSLTDYSVQEFINEIVQEYCEEVKVEEDNPGIDNVDELKTVLETYFRTRTYLGCAQTMLGTNSKLKPIEVQVVLHFDSRAPEVYQTLNSEYCRFLLNSKIYGKRVRHSFPAKYLDVLEIHADIERYEKVDKVYTDFREVINNPPDQTKRKILIQKFDKENAKLLLSSTKTNKQTNGIEFELDKAKLRKHETALKRINGIYLVLGQKRYLAKYFHIGTKQIISVNGLPTDISLFPPLGARAYLNNLLFIIDVDYTLGFGKRNLPGRAKPSIDAFFHEAWKMIRRVAPLVVGLSPDVDRFDLPKWDAIGEFLTYQDGSNKFRQSKFFLKITPREEQEVIALFFELIGKKILKGYFPFRVGGKTIYDGLFYIDRDQGDTIPQNINANDLRTVEFKYCVSRLLTDLDDETKFLTDIDLLVCWENDARKDIDYSIHSLSREERIAPFPGAQLRIKRGKDSCQVLVLKDYLESLKLI
jgi:hypothetical protein